MSKRAGKSVLGPGNEFSWVGNEGPASKPTGKTESHDAATQTQADTSATEAPRRPSQQDELDVSPMPRKEAASREVDVPVTTEPAGKRTSGNGQKLGVYLQSSTVRELKMQAIRENRSASAIVEQLVTEYCSTQARLRG